MSTPAEALANVEAAGVALQEDLQLHGWEVHILTVLVWTPAALHLFVERLRPGVLELAQAVGVLVKDERQYFDCFPPAELAAARDFIAAVDKAWPEMATRRRT